MGKQIKTNLEEMKVTSAEQINYSAIFKAELINVQKSIENVEGYWNAESGRVYVAKFKNLRNYMEDQASIMEAVGNYFNTAEVLYEETDKAHKNAFSGFCSSLQGSI